MLLFNSQLFSKFSVDVFINYPENINNQTSHLSGFLEQINM